MILKKLFRTLKFVDSLPKLTLGSIWETLRWPPIPGRNITSVTEFSQQGKKVFFFLFSSFSVQIKVRNMIKPSSVTKRKIMVGIVKCLGIVYTPHQCWYSDRKSPYWEKSLKVPQCASGTSLTMPNTLPSWSYHYLTLCTTRVTFFAPPRG